MWGQCDHKIICTWKYDIIANELTSFPKESRTTITKEERDLRITKRNLFRPQPGDQKELVLPCRRSKQIVQGKQLQTIAQVQHNMKQHIEECRYIQKNGTTVVILLSLIPIE